MSTLKSVTLLTGSVAALALSACSHSAQADRYGNVYDYEGGAACVENCGAPATSRYGDTGYVQQAPVYQGRTENVIYADCSVINGMACPAPVAQPAQVYTQPAPVYTQPAPVYTQQAQTYTTQAAPADCPAGTTPNGDGTCMQNSYESTTSYSAPATSYESYNSSSTYSTGVVESAPCPAGTTAAGDGTCMESSYSSSTSTYGSTSYDSTPSYGATTDYGSSYGTTSSTPVSCPSGTTPNGDGSCAMNEGYSVDDYQGGSVEVYQGGYTNTGGYTATDYRPVRK